MKISILTATYNRANLLLRVYESILQNLEEGIEVQWLIMDDGSTDATKELVETLIKEKKILIQYYYQKNQGKMKAMNELVEKASGDILIDCDSDDYFSNQAFVKIEEEWEKHKNRKDIYALCFLKHNQNGNNMGQLFKKQETTMFDLYFKEGETGEKALAFFTAIRKQYHHQMEEEERFVTEAGLYHQIDKDYHMICINEPIMICEYQEEGYTKSIRKQWVENPNGYYFYFKEILQFSMKNVLLKKRLYAIKHYIMFASFAKRKIEYRKIKNWLNRCIAVLLYLPIKVFIK